MFTTAKLWHVVVGVHVHGADHNAPGSELDTARCCSSALFAKGDLDDHLVVSRREFDGSWYLIVRRPKSRQLTVDHQAAQQPRAVFFSPPARYQDATRFFLRQRSRTTGR
jgi:hypothetical protein